MSLLDLGDTALFRGIPDSTGTDRRNALRITLDAHRDVVDVRVLDVDALRRPDAFVDALHEAFGAADGARALAAFDRAGRAEELLARAEETLSGRSPATAPPRPDVSREACAARRAARAERPAPPPTPPPTTSDNGYLAVHRGVDGRLLSVDVDAEWLGGVRPRHLQQAVLQACRAGGGVR